MHPTKSKKFFGDPQKNFCRQSIRKIFLRENFLWLASEPKSFLGEKFFESTVDKNFSEGLRKIFNTLSKIFRALVPRALKIFESVSTRSIKIFRSSSFASKNFYRACRNFWGPKNLTSIKNFGFASESKIFDRCHRRK